MARAKTQLFTDKQNKLAVQMKALAHPARIAIIQLLVHNKSFVGKQLIDLFGLSQATISQHIKELRNAGFVKGKKEDKSIRYFANTSAWNKYKATIASVFSDTI